MVFFLSQSCLSQQVLLKLLMLMFLILLCLSLQIPILLLFLSQLLLSQQVLLILVLVLLFLLPLLILQQILLLLALIRLTHYHCFPTDTAAATASNSFLLTSFSESIYKNITSATLTSPPRVTTSPTASLGNDALITNYPSPTTSGNNSASNAFSTVTTYPS